MTEHPKKRKRKTSYPSRYSDSEGTTTHIENNGIFFDHCYSVCSIKQQQESKVTDNEEEPANIELCKEANESAVLNDISYQEEVPAEAQEVEVESASPQNHEEEVKEPCATENEISEKGQCSNTAPAHKWPLLRANSSGLFKCEHCGFNSKYFSDLKQHMVLKHKCTESHICKVCKQSFSSDDSLLEHGRIHNEELYNCKYCSYKTKAFEKLSQHVADVHFTDFLYWCEQCDLQFCTSSELYLHFQEHSCDEQYLCQFCEHETSDPEDLHSHVVNEHACRLIELSDSYNSAERGRFSLLNKISFDKSKNFFVCQACGFRSRLHTNVNRHVAIEHTRFFPHVCDDCGKGFSGMLEYSQHLNLHLSAGVFLCQYCEYSTGQLEDLKTHLDFRHSIDLPQKCNSCLMRFGTEEELKNHLPIHESN